MTPPIPQRGQTEALPLVPVLCHPHCHYPREKILILFLEKCSMSICDWILVSSFKIFVIAQQHLIVVTHTTVIMPPISTYPGGGLRYILSNLRKMLDLTLLYAAARLWVMQYCSAAPKSFSWCTNMDRAFSCSPSCHIQNDALFIQWWGKAG